MAIDAIVDQVQHIVLGKCELLVSVVGLATGYEAPQDVVFLISGGSPIKA